MAGDRAGGITPGAVVSLCDLDQCENLGPMHALELTGILGWAERVITALGAWGVGLLS